MNLQNIVNETLTRLDQRPDLAKRFLEAAPATRRYTIGKNCETLRINQLVSLNGVIDDFATTATTWQGIPIVKTRDIPKDALIANCSTSISPVAVLKHLGAAGLKNVVGLHELVTTSNGSLPWPKFVLSQRAELQEHREDWTTIYNALGDNE